MKRIMLPLVVVLSAIATFLMTTSMPFILAGFYYLLAMISLPQLIVSYKIAVKHYREGHAFHQAFLDFGLNLLLLIFASVLMTLMNSGIKQFQLNPIVETLLLAIYGILLLCLMLLRFYQQFKRLDKRNPTSS